MPRTASSARKRLLAYLLLYPLTAVSTDELMVVSGIADYARRIRELRKEHGWRIASGASLKEMADEEEVDLDALNLGAVTVEDYILLDTAPDETAAERWRTANKIRRQKGKGVRAKILQYLLANVGAPVSGEELRYVANDQKEWARRVRELRTEDGWPIATKATGRPDLQVSVYLLESARQAPAHDRRIPDAVRREVLRRDDYRCRECDWGHDLWNRSDPRHLECHHAVRHVDRGSNDARNLVTLCTVCHDRIHA